MTQTHVWVAYEVTRIAYEGSTDPEFLYADTDLGAVLQLVELDYDLTKPWHPDAWDENALEVLVSSTSLEALYVNVHAVPLINHHTSTGDET